MIKLMTSGNLKKFQSARKDFSNKRMSIFEHRIPLNNLDRKRACVSIYNRRCYSPTKTVRHFPSEVVEQELLSNRLERNCFCVWDRKWHCRQTIRSIRRVVFWIKTWTEIVCSHHILCDPSSWKAIPSGTMNRGTFSFGVRQTSKPGLWWPQGLPVLPLYCRV